MDFLVQLREKVITDVASFFHSFSLRRLPVLDSIKDIIVKEEHILAWAETDSLETAVRRREYIISKYREMILRKFLEAHRKHFRSGQPTTAIDLQIISLLSDAHLFALETLQTQMSIHGLKWERMCSSSLFEGESRDRGAVIARSNTNIRDIVAVGSVVDLAVDPADFFGVFRRGPDVQLIPSDSSSSSSSSQPHPISPNDSFSQRHLDTALTSTNPSISTDSRMLFTTDDIPLGVGTTVDQILMPTDDVTSQDFIEPLAQLRASVNQIQIERVQKRDDAENLKDVLLLHIRGLEQRFTEILEQQDRTYRGLFAHVRQEFQLQKAALSLEVLESRQKPQSQQVAWSLDMDNKLKGVQDQQAAISHDLMEFRVQAQENFNTLTSQLSELVDYINRGGDAKKGESGSSRGPQPPPVDRGRPGSSNGGSRPGGGSRSKSSSKRYYRSGGSRKGSGRGIGY
ncbi:hypothetical protein F511_17238 [Dorcoceras hygrometricum]|uniref:Uncharacterized protein n=1 Tax=Dorcoceras hygrometricum TaxID=472368 RepID=A0A2Z7CSQ8_9LAMI|nr:hypothetical protein F511_17238 [Dorcoceras hygrometricum]